MTHSRCFNIVPWRKWITGLVPVVLILLSVGCRRTPPTIIGFEPSHPSVAFGDTIQIGVVYAPNDYGIDKFMWSASEGRIIGNGKPIITYQAPSTPGSYIISVQMMYSTGIVEDSLVVQVVPPMIAPNTTSTSTPTYEPDNISTKIPASIPTLTITPTPSTTSTPLPPSPTSTQTATPTPTPEAVVVATNGLNLRYGPGIIYDPPIGYLSNGDILDVKGRTANSEWIQVVSSRRGIEGWVSAKPEYVQINMDLDSIPIVVELPPTPAPTPTARVIDLASAPTLVAPQDGAILGPNDPIVLAWAWPDKLQDQDLFTVRLWGDGELPETHALVRDTHLELDRPKLSPGIYFWNVAVARFLLNEQTWVIVSDESEVRQFLLLPDILQEPTKSRLPTPPINLATPTVTR
jgi:hypothetical protein